jgi:ABC-2 type transport system ATP-binding protein
MIEIDGLTKRYGDKAAVDGLSFVVEPGVVTGFLGPNGAGKPNLGKRQFFAPLPRRPRAASHDTRVRYRPLPLPDGSCRPPRDGTAVRGPGRRPGRLVPSRDGRPGRR